MFVAYVWSVFDMFLNTATEHDNNNSAEDNLHKLLFITVADVTSWKLSTVIQQSDQHLKTFMEQ